MTPEGMIRTGAIGAAGTALCSAVPVAAPFQYWRSAAPRRPRPSCSAQEPVRRAADGAILVDGRTRRLLGTHILAPEGADSIQTAAPALRGRLTIDDLAETIFPYLTTVEGLKLPAQAFDRDVATLSCSAG